MFRFLLLSSFFETSGQPHALSFSRDVYEQSDDDHDFERDNGEDVIMNEW